MPQLFQALKCFKCAVFQVHQAKKSNKWQCKLCGEKQSIKRHYGIGTGKECRLHVQKLNGIRGEIDELNNFIELNKTSDEENEVKEENHFQSKTSSNQHIESKWSTYVDNTEQITKQEAPEKMFLGTTEVVLEIPAKRRKKFNAPKVIHKSTTVNEFEETAEPKYKSNKIPISNSLFPQVDVCKNINIETMPMFETHKNKNKFHTFNSENIKPNKLNGILKVNNEHKIQDKKVYVPPQVEKNSKWAQFTEEPDENENAASVSSDNSIESTLISNTKSLENAPNSLFKLCDENELDDVLNF